MKLLRNKTKKLDLKLKALTKQFEPFSEFLSAPKFRVIYSLQNWGQYFHRHRSRIRNITEAKKNRHLRVLLQVMGLVMNRNHSSLRKFELFPIFGVDERIWCHLYRWLPASCVWHNYWKITLKMSLNEFFGKSKIHFIFSTIFFGRLIYFLL